MLHTEFQGRQSIDSGEEDYERFFTIYERGGHIGYVIWTVWTDVCLLYP